MSVWRARQKSTTNSSALLGVVLFLLSSFSPASLPAAGMGNSSVVETIELGDGMLTVRLRNASLRHTLEEIGRLSRAEIVWLNPTGEETLSAEFTALPLPEGLERLLRGKNFLLFYTGKGGMGKLSQVWISSRLDNKAKPVGAGGLLVSTARSREAQQPFQRKEERAGGEEALSALSLDEVVQVALGEKNPAGRLDAIALLGQEAHENPRLKVLLSRIAREDPDPAARQIASLTLGETTK